MKNEKGKGGKYLEKEEKEKGHCCSQDGQVDGWTEIEGSIRGPRGRKKKLFVALIFYLIACTTSGKMKPSNIINGKGTIL